MAETVHVPGVKKPLPKWAVFAGIGGVAVAVIYYYRTKSSSSTTAAAAATTTDQYPPDGTTGDPTDPYSTDPATGQTYGDEAVGAGTYGAYGTAAGSYSADSGVIGYDANGNPIYAPGYGPASTGTATGGPPFSNNAAWSNWVIAQLEVNDPNLSTTDVQNAIGEYLAGQPLSAAYQTIAFDAIAVGGDPPVAGPNNYPPNVQGDGSTGGTTTTGTGTGTTANGTVKVPSVTGLSVDKAHAALSAAGLAFNADTAASKPGYTRLVTAQNPAAGTTVPSGTHVGLTWHYTQGASTGSTGTGGGSGSSSGQVRVPNVVGQTVNAAHSALSGAGLAFNADTAKDKAGYSRIVTAESPKAGTSAARGTHVGLTWHYVKG